MNPYDNWALARVVAGVHLNGELERVSSPYRRLFDHLVSQPLEARQAALGAFLKSRSEAEELEIILALAGIRTEDPPPDEPTRSYATLADVAKIVSGQSWLWKGWIAAGVLNVVASEPGVGKTRFGVDLARRLWFGLSLPDNQPNEFPAGTRTLWVQADHNFGELLQAARDFGLPDEAVVLGSSPEEPFGSLDLDDPATLAALEKRILDSGARLVIIDTVMMTTSQKLSLPEGARAYFTPLLGICQRTGAGFLGLTHLSANKEALGRRIVEKARVVIKMTHPDPEGQPHRRRLWVDKSAIQKPPALGITMGKDGNVYDFNPPTEPESTQRRPGPPPAKLEACKKWLMERLTPIPAMVKDVRADAEKPENGKFSVDTLYKAKDALGVEEYTFEGRKWWQLPVVDDVVDFEDAVYDDSDNSDNFDNYL